MNGKPAVKLSIVAVIILLFSYWCFSGFHIGLYDYKPFFPTIPQGLDIAGGMSAVYRATDAGDYSSEDLSVKIEAAIAIMRSRLDSKGYTEATINKQGTDRIRVEIPGASDVEAVRALINKPAELEFKDKDGNVIMTGKDVQSARPSYQSSTEVGVSFQLTDEGAKKFADATAKKIGETISIVLDGEVISSPKVESVISNGSGVISGNFTYDTANDLAIAIESGTLPLNMEEAESRTQSATLGQGVLTNSIWAAVIGLALVILLMTALYRLPGFISGIGLFVYLIILLFMLATVPGVQLTLAGIAGVILSIGMAVDANVIIYERFLEERYAGKNLRTAMELGFSKAFSAIVDGNITTLIAAAVLYYLGTGTVRNFAITLLLGTLVSMFTALVVVKFFLRCLLSFKKMPPSWFASMKKVQTGGEKQ